MLSKYMEKLIEFLKEPKNFYDVEMVLLSVYRFNGIQMDYLTYKDLLLGQIEEIE